MGAIQQDLEVTQGKTFEAAFGWAQGRFVWKPISAVAQLAPVQLTVIGHDLKDGWPYWISDLKKPACLNNVQNGCEGLDDELGDPYLAEVVDANTLSINHINGMRLEAYGAGGVVRYWAREDITNYTAEMQVRRRAADDQVLFTASSTGVGPMIIVDVDAAMFRLSIPADAFDAADFTSGVYEIEIESPDGKRYQLAFGKFQLGRDVVR